MKLIVRVLDPERDNYFITKWFFSNREKGKVIDMFFYEGHFTGIKNLSRLLSKQMSGQHRSKCYFCIKCDNVMKSLEAKISNEKVCLGNRTKRYPKMNPVSGKVSKQKFRNISNISYHAFVAYADCESFLEKICEAKGKNTEKMQKHITSCIGT